MKIKIEYLNVFKDRHGKTRAYARLNRKVKPIAIKARPIGSAAFMVEFEAAIKLQESLVYERLLDRLTDPAMVDFARHVLKDPRDRATTIAWLFERYKQSAEWSNLKENTRKAKANRFEEWLIPYGDLPWRQLSSVHVAAIRDEKRDTAPTVGSRRVKDISALYKWAGKVSVGLAVGMKNPADGVEDLPNTKINDDGSTGHKPWTPDLIDQFLGVYGLGSMQYLAMRIFEFTGARVSDAYLMGPHTEYEPGQLRWVETKNSGKVDKDTGKTLRPTITTTVMLPGLREAIDAARDRAKIISLDTWLLSSRGQPFKSAKSFSQWFVKHALRAGIPEGYTPHGIRKADAIRCAEGGASAKQLMALFGWSKMATAEEYVTMASQPKLAREAAKHLQK